MYQNEQEAIAIENVVESTLIETSELDVGNSRLGLGVIMIMAAFLGLWGTACIISGLATLGSLKEAGSTLLNALLGV